MDAVVLEQRRILVDRLEPEGDDRRAVLRCEIGIDRVEITLVVGPVIGRRTHAHQQHRDFAALELAKHGFEIGACFGRRDSAQHVVAAQFEHHQIGLGVLRIEREGQPLRPCPAGFPRDRGIGDQRIDPLPAQRRFELGRIAVFAPHAIAREEAVAEGEDVPLGPLDRHRRGGRCGARRRVGSRCTVVRAAAGGERKTGEQDRQMPQAHRRVSLCMVGPHAIAGW